MPFASPSRLRTFVPGALLLALLAGAYAYSLRGDFLWDDDLHITKNPTIVGPQGLKEIWTTSAANYFPLVLTNFWIQHALWELEPFGYRVVTLAFHLAAALLLWRVLRQLGAPTAGAWLGAALWALHPVQVESVAWICELKNTQSAVFFLAAVVFWLRWLEGGRVSDPLSKMRDAIAGGSKTRPTSSSRASYSLALFCALLAILSKPSTVMLPIALALCTWWVHGTGISLFEPARSARSLVSGLWSLVFPLAPFFALSAIAAGWTIWEQKFHAGAIGDEWSQTFPERIAIAGRVIWFYLGKLAWPEPLMFIYPRWQIDAGSLLAYGPVAAAALGLLALLWRGRDGALRPVLFAAVFFVALLFPVLGFFSVYFFRYSFVGDHFQYLASMGPLALAGIAVARATPRLRWPAATLLVVSLTLLTARHARTFLDNETLWRDTLARNPTAMIARVNLADTLAKAGRHDEAIVMFRRALELQPNDAPTLNDLGCELTIVGRPEEATPLFERAIELKPADPEPHSNLGHALRALGRSDAAVAHYRRALELDPNYTDAMNNLGAELAERGDLEPAAQLFRRVIELESKNAAAHDNLAGALRKLGRVDEALPHHEAALRLRPAFAEAHANFGRTLAAAGRLDAAFAAFERALELKPNVPDLYGGYAAALASAGRHAHALTQLERAIQHAPASPQAHLNLGTMLAQSGQLEDALPRFEAALRLAPDLPAAHLNLGNALAALGRWDDAAARFESASRLQPDSAQAHTQLAVALVNAGRIEAAVPQFETALRLAPSAESHEQFAQVLRALGRTRDAFEHLERAADIRRNGAR